MPKRSDRLPVTVPHLVDLEPGQRALVEIKVIGGKGYLGGTRVEIHDKELALPDDTPVTLAD